MVRLPRAEFDRIARLQREKSSARKSKRAAKALTLWPAPAAASHKPRRIATARQRLRARLDTLWSLVIRKRDNRATGGLCRICGTRKIECAYHITPRSADATRWDLENGVGACHACNYGEQQNRLAYREKHVVLFGAAKIEYLESASRKIVRFSMADLQEIYDNIAQELTK